MYITISPFGASLRLESFSSYPLVPTGSGAGALAAAGTGRKLEQWGGGQWGSFYGGRFHDDRFRCGGYGRNWWGRKLNIWTPRFTGTASTETGESSDLLLPRPSLMLAATGADCGPSAAILLTACLHALCRILHRHACWNTRWSA